MTYHISLSQDGRSYSLLMFLGMAGLYFFMKHLKSSKKRYLILVALFFAILFHTSYSSIPFIAFSQILWFYRPNEESKKPTLSSFFILNGLILLFCLPWIIFVVVNYIGQPLWIRVTLKALAPYLISYMEYYMIGCLTTHSRLFHSSCLFFFPSSQNFGRTHSFLWPSSFFP